VPLTFLVDLVAWQRVAERMEERLRACIVLDWGRGMRDGLVDLRVPWPDPDATPTDAPQRSNRKRAAQQHKLNWQHQIYSMGRSIGGRRNCCRRRCFCVALYRQDTPLLAPARPTARSPAAAEAIGSST
jgi:hypothetical protein